MRTYTKDFFLSFCFAKVDLGIFKSSGFQILTSSSQEGEICSYSKYIINGLQCWRYVFIEFVVRVFDSDDWISNYRYPACTRSGSSSLCLEQRLQWSSCHRKATLGNVEMIGREVEILVALNSVVSGERYGTDSVSGILILSFFNIVVWNCV